MHNSDNKLHPKLTLQFFTDEKCFGPGVALLLEKIKEHSSMRKAAIEIGMSYSKAYTIIRRAQKHLGFELLNSKTGGISGGGATLTTDAERLLFEYRACERELFEYCDLKYAEHFSWLDDYSDKEK